MLIEIKDLELEPLSFREEFFPGAIDFGEDLKQTTPLRSSGRAELVEEQLGRHERLQDIRLVGDLTVGVEVACARCLEPVRQEVAHTFDLLYRPLGAESGRAELSVTAAEAEISYYEGEGLLLEDALREQVILALPIKAICREDCKGLCPQCGKNLNQQDHVCADLIEDPRWSALKEIRSKLSPEQN